jgi:hypothetical protein
MVTEENLTFLVQGPIKIIDSINLTEICINSIRKHFPKSIIILSTDYGADVHKLNIDEVVFSKAKIGALIENDINGHLMSVNYQISSTKAGLNKVKTTFTVKLRSDMVFRNSNLIKILNNRPIFRPDSQYILTNSYVVILDWSTVNPIRFLKFPHHPSDHLYAGETSDIKAIWDVPEMPQEFMRWYEHREYPKNVRHGNNLPRYRAETWIWYNYIKNFVVNKINSSYFTSDKIVTESLNFMCANLMISSSNQVGVYENNFFNRDWKTYVKMLTYYDWILVSKKLGIGVKNITFDFHSIKIIFMRNAIVLFGLEKYIYRRK